MANLLGNMTLPYVKPVSVNGLKHKVIKSTYSGKTMEGALLLSLSFSYSWKKMKEKLS